MESTSTTTLVEKTRQTNGWTPLVYPALALKVSPDETNPCFPLEKNVLLATARELLILDGSITAETLELSTETTKFLNGKDTVEGLLYLRHVDPKRWNVLPEKNKSLDKGKKKKRASSVMSSSMPNKKVKTNNGSKTSASDVEEQGTSSEDLVETSCQHANDKVADAEALAELLVERSCHVPDNNIEHLNTVQTLATDKSIRKVSDADIESNNTSLTVYNDNAIKRLDETYSSTDISRFYDIRSRSMTAKETPPFLEVSIASEFVLRDLAQEMTRKLTESFDDKTLRMFLGYKSSTLKRDRLLSVLSEYIFDVSHAMYAWKQTEQEVQGETLGDTAVEQRILRTLFDSRALRKIGGFENSSLLPHALSISRLVEKDVSWREFAKTQRGKELLQHHREGKPWVAGQKRRGQRARTRNVVSSSDNSEAGPRSRSSSITSYDAPESKQNVETGVIETIYEELWSEERQASLQMPDVLHVPLRKATTSSWGVLLSKEGDMCVVVRAPAESGKDGLKIGDVVLSVGNESSTISNREERQDWFRFVVNKFKSNDELDLIVRRVGSGQTVVSDDSSLGDKADEN